MCGCYRLFHSGQIERVMQVADAITIAAAKTGHRRKSLFKGFCNDTFEIHFRFCDDCIENLAERQKIIDVPPSRMFISCSHLHVAVHALEATRTSRRTGIGIVAPVEVDLTKRANLNEPGAGEIQDERIDSRTGSLSWHDCCS